MYNSKIDLKETLDAFRSIYFYLICYYAYPEPFKCCHRFAFRSSIKAIIHIMSWYIMWQNMHMHTQTLKHTTIAVGASRCCHHCCGGRGSCKMGWALASSSSHKDISHPNLCNKLPSIPRTARHIPVYWPALLAGMCDSFLFFSKYKITDELTPKPRKATCNDTHFQSQWNSMKQSSLYLVYSSGHKTSFSPLV